MTNSPWLGTWGARLSLASLVVGAVLTFPWLYARIRARIKAKKYPFRIRWWALMVLVLGIVALLLATMIEGAVYGHSEYGISMDFKAWKRLIGEIPRVDFETWERDDSWEYVDFEAWERQVYDNNLDFWDWQGQKYGDVRTDLRPGRPPDYATRRAAWEQSPEYQALRERYTNWENSPEYQARQGYFNRVESIVLGLRTLGGLSVLLLLVRGIAGGITFSIKKLRG